MADEPEEGRVQSFVLSPDHQPGKAAKASAEVIANTTRPSRAARLRRAVRDELDPRKATQGLSVTNRVLCVLILAAVTSAVLETEPTVALHHEMIFRSLELCFGAIFTAELCLRGWCAAG